MKNQKSLQETYAPNSTCFGCGPKNKHGLRIQSYVEGNLVVAQWDPNPNYHGFPNMLSGGIISTLMDCHSNWAATYHLMKQLGMMRPMETVTAAFFVKFNRPTPTDKPLRMEARITESDDQHATVETNLISGGKITATFKGTFVAVKPHHPAFGKWNE